MSTVSHQNDLDQHDLLYYAPRRLRENQQDDWLPELLEEHASPGVDLSEERPNYDALLEGAVAAALLQPLMPQLYVQELPKKAEWFYVAAKFAALAAVIVAAFTVLYIGIAPATRTTEAIAGISSSTPKSTPRLPVSKAGPRLVVNETGGGINERLPADTPEQNEMLFQQFLQWQQKPAAVPLSFEPRKR